MEPGGQKKPAGQAWTSTVLGSVAKRKRRSEAEVVVASSSSSSIFKRRTKGKREVLEDGVLP